VLRAFGGGNEGVDFSAPEGAAVSAAAAGTVAAITRDTDQVPILVLRHEGGLLTVYANIKDIRVEKGDAIQAGQRLASVGGGNPSFLHFEVRRGFDAVDPEPLLR
jgi:murein DD-endopeptidase MepM/ murein hydrolase activator NlpD